jgi:hypothetical protein
MKTVYLRSAFALVLPALLLAGCKKEDKTVLSNAYAGTIVYEYTRGFPSFTALSTINVSLDKNGVLTSGTYQAASFDEEAVKYNGTEPEMKLHVAGTITRDAAEGNYAEISSADKVLVYIHSTIEGTMDIYGWDKDLGFYLVTSQDFTYTDDFTDGSWEFSLDDAVIAGSTISVTLPDIEGSSTYGYTLYLVPSL